jgi:hypothetical protein
VYTATSSTRNADPTRFSTAPVTFFEEVPIERFSLSSLLLRSSSCSYGGSRFRPLPHLPLVPAQRFHMSFNLVIPVGTSLVATIQPWINSASSIPRLSAVSYIRETKFASQMKSLPSAESFNLVSLSVPLFLPCILSSHVPYCLTYWGDSSG